MSLLLNKCKPDLLIGKYGYGCMATVMATVTVMATRAMTRSSMAIMRREQPAVWLVIGISFSWSRCPLQDSRPVAGKRDLDDSIDVSLTFVDRTGSDASSGPVAQVSPRFSLNRRGARAFADINYRPNLAIGGDNTKTLTHDLTARGEVEAVEDLLYINATAGAGFVGNSATSGIVDPINGSNDGSQSYSLQISPSFRPRTDNRYVSFVSNNSFDLVGYTGGWRSTDDGSTSATWNLVRGRPFFHNCNWDAGITQRTTRFDDRDDDTRTD